MNKEQVKEQIEDIITYVEEAGLDFWADDIVSMRKAVNAFESNKVIDKETVSSLLLIRDHIRHVWFTNDEEDPCNKDIEALSILIDYAA